MSEREGYFKELDHVTVEAWHDPNLQSVLAGRRLVEEVQSNSREVSLCSRHAFNWLDEVYTHYGGQTA